MAYADAYAMKPPQRPMKPMPKGAMMMPPKTKPKSGGGCKTCGGSGKCPTCC